MIAKRLLPQFTSCVLFLVLASPVLAAPLKSGEQVFKEVCSSCHEPGPVEAPKLGDKAAWAPLIAEGQVVVTAHGWVGVREMPPKGGAPKLELAEFGRAVAYMGRTAGSDWQDPDRSEQLMAAIRTEEKKRRKEIQSKMQVATDQGRSGAGVYAEICRHCHEDGVAGAPRKGDRNAWRPLIKEGQSILTAHAWVGVRAMPPRGGHPELSLEEFARAVVEMSNSAGGQWQDPSSNQTLMAEIRAEISKRERSLAQ